MVLQWSTAIRNARLEAIEATVGTAAKLQMFTGAPPANCAAAASGTKLVDITLASDWAGTATSGSKSLNNLPLTTTALAPGGTLGHYRIYDSTGATCHEQGTITATGGGGDMTVDNISVTTGQTINITAFTKLEPGI